MPQGEILGGMRKVVIAAVTFVISATLGVGLLVLWSIAEVLLHMHRVSSQTSGIAAVSVGLPRVAVLLVPLVCGVLGAAIVLNMLKRAGK